MESFYGNIGGKIKRFSFFFAVLGIIISVIFGLLVWFGLGHFLGVSRYADGIVIFFSGLAVMGIGSLIAYIGSWLLYAYGTIVENLQILADSVTGGDIALGSSRASKSSAYSSSSAGSSMLSNALKQKEADEADSGTVQKNTFAEDYWVCGKCNSRVPKKLTVCKYCGHSKW